MAITDNLAASWSLDNALTDASGNGNTLTNINTVDINATGIVNQGADFEFGSSQYLYCEDSASLSITGDISVSLWFKFESHTANVSLLTKADRADRDPYDWSVKWETSNTIIFQWSSNGSFTGTRSRFTCPLTPTDGVWYHIVATADVSVPSAAMYINGSSQTVTTVLSAATSISDSDVQTIIGADGGGNFLDGIADIVSIWSRIITSDEVTTLYNAGAGIQYPFAGGGPTAKDLSLLGVGI